MKFRAKAILSSFLLAIVLAVGVVATTAPATYAVCNNAGPDLSTKGGIDCATPSTANTTLFGTGSIFEKVINTILFFIGIMSVIYLILGGIHYVTSGGDQAAVTKAKNTILYAIIGIIVSFLAFALVNFITSQLSTATK